MIKAPALPPSGATVACRRFLGARTLLARPCPVQHDAIAAFPFLRLCVLGHGVLCRGFDQKRRVRRSLRGRHFCARLSNGAVADATLAVVLIGRWQRLQPQRPVRSVDLHKVPDATADEDPPLHQRGDQAEIIRCTDPRPGRWRAQRRGPRAFRNPEIHLPCRCDHGTAPPHGELLLPVLSVLAQQTADVEPVAKKWNIVNSPKHEQDGAVPRETGPPMLPWERVHAQHPK
mmetsp:Transcript_53625/g.162887  ORF Transcript_53625/g.162887 Transcript_53625/m.162887 type:complete len:231 (-) Transcript_53625:1174-1866(-)